MRARGHASAAAMLVTISTAACVVGADYVAPETPVPAAWDTDLVMTGVGAVTADAAWWSSFDDPLLTRLLTQALTANYDLQKAEAAVLEARAVRSRAVVVCSRRSTARHRTSAAATAKPWRPPVSSHPAGWSMIASAARSPRAGKSICSARCGTRSAADAGIGAFAGGGGQRPTRSNWRGGAHPTSTFTVCNAASMSLVAAQAQRDTLDLRAPSTRPAPALVSTWSRQGRTGDYGGRAAAAAASLKAGFHRLGVLTSRGPAALIPLLAEPRPDPSGRCLAGRRPTEPGPTASPTFATPSGCVAEATTNIGVPSPTGPDAVDQRHHRHRRPRPRRSPAVGQPGMVVGPRLDVPVFDGRRRQAEVEVQKAKAEQPGRSTGRRCSPRWKRSRRTRWSATAPRGAPPGAGAVGGDLRRRAGASPGALLHQGAQPVPRCAHRANDAVSARSISPSRSQRRHRPRRPLQGARRRLGSSVLYHQPRHDAGPGHDPRNRSP